MRIVFLGTGGYHPNERRHTSGIMLPEAGMVFDAGTGFFRMPALLKTKTLDVFLTHGHLDHICGLTFPIVPLLKGQLDQIQVFGTSSTLVAVENHLLDRSLFPVRLPKTKFNELPDDGCMVGLNGRLTHIPLEHPGGSTGYRIDWPELSLAYITDTTAPGSYVEFIRDVDVLIHECNFCDDMSEWSAKTGHSNTTPVATLAKQAGVKRLYLTHIDPQREDDDPIGLETARSIFPRTWVAEDRMEIEF